MRTTPHRVQAGTSAIGHDAETLQRCRQGDRAALSRVLSAELPRVERLLRRLLGPGADVEDVLQATLESAIRGFGGFRGEASVATWLSRIAVRTAMSHVRRAGTRTLAGGVESLVETWEGDFDTAERVDKRQRLRAFYAHLEKVGRKQRTAFVLHVLEGRSMEETAALMGAGVSTTKSRVFWARRALMRSLSRDPDTRAWLHEYTGEGASDAL